MPHRDQYAVISLTIGTSLNSPKLATVNVPQDVFDNLAALLDDKQIVEVTVTVSAYNMVSRILVALNVADKADEKVPEVST